MANPNNEGIPLLQLNKSAKNEEDLNDSRETETTDDECPEDVEDCVTSVEKSNHSLFHLATDSEQSGTSPSRSLPSFDQPGQSSDYSVAHFGQPGPSSDPSVSYFDQPGPSSNQSVTRNEWTFSSSDNSSSDDLSETSSTTLNSQVGKGQDVLSYFTGETVTSSSDSNKVSSGASSVDLGCVIEYTLDEQGNVDYVDIDFDESISEKHVVKLMNKLRLNHYTSISCEGDFTLSKCRGLFERDYYCEVIDNPGGSLSRNYPARVIIPVAQKSMTASSERLDVANFNLQSYHGKVKRSVYSRLLTRFVVPVILFDKKFICRSGSLTVRKTAVFESARQKGAPKDQEISTSVIQHITRRLADSLADISNRTRRAASQLFLPNSMVKLRDVDAEIMRALNIQHICDLMVEDRKKFKQTIRVSSSEKINKDIFKDSAIQQMPYPGCSFFRRYHEANYYAHRLIFDWERSDVNVEMMFSIDPNLIFPDINWKNYKEWNVIDLTRNYLKMLLLFLVKDSGGMLVHCISGWDRTPLFISMLRVSLWADGLVHQSLDYRDMAYLTLAYDWYLFGHNLPRRLNQKEEIMHFCFNFFGYIANDEFSASRIFHELPDDIKKGRKFPEYVPDRRHILKVFRAYVMETYAEYITKYME